MVIRRITRHGVFLSNERCGRKFTTTPSLRLTPPGVNIGPRASNCAPALTLPRRLPFKGNECPAPSYTEHLEGPNSGRARLPCGSAL